jgi:hypothetical protein
MSMFTTNRAPASRQTTIQPRSGGLPLAGDRRARHREDGGDLLLRQSAEIPELHNLTLPRINPGQFDERFVHHH